MQWTVSWSCHRNSSSIRTLQCNSSAWHSLSMTKLHRMGWEVQSVFSSRCVVTPSHHIQKVLCAPGADGKADPFPETLHPITVQSCGGQIPEGISYMWSQFLEEPCSQKQNARCCESMLLSSTSSWCLTWFEFYNKCNRIQTVCSAFYRHQGKERMNVILKMSVTAFSTRKREEMV